MSKAATIEAQDVTTAALKDNWDDTEGYYRQDSRPGHTHPLKFWTKKREKILLFFSILLKEKYARKGNYCLPFSAFLSKFAHGRACQNF